MAHIIDLIQICLQWEYRPFRFLRNDGNGTHVYDGYAFVVLNLLAEKYNFTQVPHIDSKQLL